MFTSYLSIRSQEHDTHPSVSKCCMNVPDPATKERYCWPSEDWMEKATGRSRAFFVTAEPFRTFSPDLPVSSVLTVYIMSNGGKKRPLLSLSIKQHADMEM